MRYDFIREGGCWVIDDMSSTVDGSPWILRGLLGDATIDALVQLPGTWCPGGSSVIGFSVVVPDSADN